MQGNDRGGDAESVGVEPATMGVAITKREVDVAGCALLVLPVDRSQKAGCSVRFLDTKILDLHGSPLRSMMPGYSREWDSESKFPFGEFGPPWPTAVTTDRDLVRCAARRLQT